nr:hypothetical protein [Tanacetum cinerariifolium]
TNKLLSASCRHFFIVTSMETDFLHLKRQLAWLKGYAAVSSLLFLLLGLLALTPPNRDVIRAKGLTFNDDEGFERGGLGVGLTATGQYRAMVGLDDANGREAVHLMALEDGTKGILIGHQEGKLFLGSAKANNGLINSPTDVSGLLAIDKEGKVLPT